MNINQLSESKYLKKDDCQPPITVTISGMTQENLAQENEAPEYKYVLQFKEAVKPLVLNMTNARMIAVVTGSEETNDWIGKKITLFNDPSVSFAGKLTGGIRVQMMAPQAASAAAEDSYMEQMSQRKEIEDRGF